MFVKDLIVTGDAKILGNLYTKDGNVGTGGGGGGEGGSGVTYKLTKSGSTITLTGSDGSTSSVTDANTTTSVDLSGYVPTSRTVNGKALTGNISLSASDVGASASNHSHSAATTGAAGLMSAADKQKLDGIAAGANNYTYSLPAASSSTLGGVKIGSNISVSSGTISLTKANVTNALGYTPPTTNTTYSAATQSAAGLMSAADKKKLDGIASGANNYTYSHPTSSGNKHIPSGGSAGQILRWSSDGTAVWGNDNNTTYTLGSFGITATAAELNYCDGVTSNIQTQLNGKSASGHLHSNYMTTSNPTGTGYFSLNRKSGSTIGDYSFAEGYNNTASYSCAHAEGNLTIASGECAHSEGHQTNAIGTYSHAEGLSTNANEKCAHSEGEGTTASGISSHAEGYYTTALLNQHAQGHFNNTSIATATSSRTGTGTGTAFVIGNGTSVNASNAFRVNYNGQPYAKSSFTTTGCDYAEYFEWADGNTEETDRRGYFVTLDGEKIKIAEPGDYILGIVSGQPSVIGNGDEEWTGRYIMDEFGAFIYEEFEFEEEVINKETGEKEIVVSTATRYKQNPEYDPTRKYVHRSDRCEWDAIGMLGVLSVIDDGTCKVNGFCNVSEGGIATESNDGYRVIDRVNDNMVKVIFR